MKQSQRKDRTVHFPFFKRSQVLDDQFINYPQNKYTLIGVARCTNSYCDIYRVFFPNFFKKTLDRTEKTIKKEHLSQFFMCYFNIIAIQTFVNLRQGFNSTGKAQKILSGFSSYHGSMNQFQEIQFQGLKNFLFWETNKIVEDNARMAKEQTPMNEFQRLKEAKRKIRQEINRIYRLLKEDFQRIDKIQYLFELKVKIKEERKERVIQLVMNSLQSMANMDLIFVHRIEVLKNFTGANRSQWRIQINQIEEKTSYRIGEKIDDKDYENDIFMPQPTKDRNPITSRLKDFVPILHQSKCGPLAFNHHQKEAMRAFIQFMKEFNKKSNLFFPNIEVNSLFWDQKQLKIITSYTPLIESAYGLDKNVRTIEMSSAFESTPELITEKCYKEDYKEYYKYEKQPQKSLFMQELKENQIWLKLKYYFPQIQNKLQQKKESVVSQGTGKHSSSQNQTPTPEKDLAKRTQLNKIAQLEENIHVWRLLQILYYISQNESLSKYAYSQYKKTDKGKNQKISMSSLIDAKKQFYNNLKQNPYILQSLLKPIFIAIKQQNQLNQINYSTPNNFDFKLQSLSNTLGIVQEDDSLMNSLKDLKLISQLLTRQFISKDIINMLSAKKYFNALANVKKYLILIYLNHYEQIHFLLFQLKHDYKKRQILSSLYKKAINDIVIEEQRLRRTYNSKKIFQKFEQYDKRRDKNTQFLNNNQFRRMADQNDKRINNIKLRSQRLKTIMDDEAIYENKIEAIKKLSQSVKNKHTLEDLLYLQELLSRKHLLEQTLLQINSISASTHKKTLIINLLTKSSDSQRLSLIREILKAFQIPIKIPSQKMQQEFQDDDNFILDHKIKHLWNNEKNRKIFIRNFMNKIQFPTHSLQMINILRKHNTNIEYLSLRKKIATKIESDIKQQLSALKQTVRINYFRIFKELIADNVDDLNKFFIWKESENRKKITYYQYLIYKITGLIILSIFPDSNEFNRDTMYNTFFWDPDNEREKKQKYDLDIMKARIQNIKSQIFNYGFQNEAKLNAVKLNHIQDPQAEIYQSNQISHQKSNQKSLSQTS